MMGKKVSIVVPVYNSEEVLPICLESLIRQTYSNIQIILVNDGSSDKSLMICKEYQKRDNRIEVYSHNNKGVSYTRNQGICHAVGEYLMFIDSDDYVNEDMISNYVNAMELNDVDVVIGGIHFINQDKSEFNKMPNTLGILERKDFWKALCQEDNGIFGYVPNKLYRTEIIKSNGIQFDEKNSAQEDFAFALSVYSVAKRFFVMDYSGYNYLYIPSNRSVPIEVLIGNQQKILKEAIEYGVDKEYYQKIVRKIQNFISTYLHNCKSKKDIVFVMEIPNLIQSTSNIEGICGEQRIVLKWFYKKQVNCIWNYFCIRKTIRKILRRKTV